MLFKKKKTPKPETDTSWAKGEMLDFAEFDLDCENNHVKGVFVLTKKSIQYKTDEKIVTIPLEEIENIEANLDFGVYSFELVKKDGSTVAMFHSSVERSEELANVVHAVQSALTNPESLENYRKREQLRCPKCGKPLRPGQKQCDKCINKWDTLKRLCKMVVPHKWGIVIVVGVFLLTTAMSLVEPKINQRLVDGYLTNEAQATLAESSPKAVLVPFIITTLMLLVFQLLTWGMTFLRNYVMAKIGINAILDVRQKLYSKVQRLSISKIEKRTTGAIMHRLSRDAGQVQNFIDGMVPNFFGQLFLLIAVSFILVFYAGSLGIGWKLLLIFLAPLPITVVAIFFSQERMRKIFGRQWEASAATSNVLHDILSGIRVVKAYGTEERENEHYCESADYERRLSIKNETLNAKIQPFVRFGLTLGSFMLLYFTGNQILKGTLTIGECSMFTSYISMVYGPLQFMANFPLRLANTLTSAGHIFELMDEDEEMGALEEGVVREIDGTISFENVTFGYEPTRQVLKNITFEIHPGEMIGLVGRSGVGKTTLTNLVMRLYDVENGRICVDGIDIRDYSQECYRSQVGAVLQETVLFSASLYDNLVYAKPDATMEEVLACSKAAGVHDFAVKLPNGYNTLIGEKGYTISGGERQRVAIARAILRNPRILILDEATSSLDTEMEKQIQDAIEVLIKDRTTIAIAHRLSTLRNATKIMVIDEGRIAEIGTHEELIAKRGLYYELVLAQRVSSIGNEQE